MKKSVSSEMVIFMTIFGLTVLAMGILEPILPLYLTSINVTPSVLGLMVSVGWIGMAIGEPSWGWVADRIGNKLPISAGTFVCALTILLFVFTFTIGIRGDDNGMALVQQVGKDL